MRADGKVDYTLAYANTTMGYIGYGADTQLRLRGWAQAEVDAQLAQTLAYQASLTKAGKPRKGVVAA